MYEYQEDNVNPVNYNPNLTVVIQQQREPHKIAPVFTSHSNVFGNMNNSVLAESGIEDIANMSLNASDSEMECTSAFNNESIISAVQASRQDLGTTQITETGIGKRELLSDSPPPGPLTTYLTFDGRFKRLREEFLERVKKCEAEVEAKQQEEIEQLRQTLALMDKSNAEEEANIRFKKEKIGVKKKSRAAEEQKTEELVKAMQAETKMIEKELEGRREKTKKAKFMIQTGNSITSVLGIQYCKTTGKYLCPEGKICWGVENESEYECNYWDCPYVQEQIKLVEQPKPN